MSIPVSFWGQTIADNTLKDNGQPETANFSIPITTITAGNLVTVTTALGTLASAIAGVIMGNVVKTELVSDRAEGPKTPAASTLAQRENKLLVRYHDNVTFENFRVSLPTFDLSTLPAHSEFVDLTAGVGAALKSALEAVLASPTDASHTCTVDSAQFVGRNS